MRKRNIFLLVFIIFVVLLALVSYGYYKLLRPSSSKIGEASFYKDADIELKVVLIHENIPLHYVGNHYSVVCQSQNTQDFPRWEGEKIEKGWNVTPGSYLGNSLETDKNLLLQNLVNEAKKLYLVKDKLTLIVLREQEVYVSFDGCRSFSNWVLKDNVPDDFIVESTPEFEKCVEEQKKDKELGLTSYGECSYQKFVGKNRPIFRDIVANDSGYATFKVVSPAFKDSRTINVETSDFGKTWKFISDTSIVR